MDTGANNVSLTISDVSMLMALYTLPHVPSPSSFKILYLKVVSQRKYKNKIEQKGLQLLTRYQDISRETNLSIIKSLQQMIFVI